MRLGTKTLLFGYHQIFIHFFFVLRAWVKLFGWRDLVEDPKMVVAIFIHDFGYWGQPNLDGEEGKQHPAIAAEWALNHLGTDYWYQIYFHSRSMSVFKDKPTLSRIGVADKLAFLLYPKWLTKLLQYMSGEVYEYLSRFHVPPDTCFDPSFDGFYYWGSVGNVDAIVRYKWVQTDKMRDWLSNHKVVGNYYRRKYVTTS